MGNLTKVALRAFCLRKRRFLLAMDTLFIRLFLSLSLEVK